MKRTTFFSSLLVAALGIVMVTTANTAAPASMAACTFTWVGGASGAENDWRVDANWTDPPFCDHSWPVAGDTAIIPDTDNDPVIDQQDEAVTSLNIQHDGVLTVTGQTLTIDGSAGLDIDPRTSNLAGLLIVDGTNGKVILSGGGSSTLDGELQLATSTAVLEIQSSNTTLTGSAGVDGQNASAKISINNTLTLTSSTTFDGMMSIEETSGTASFVNNGTVRADDAGTLSLGANVTLTGSGAFEAKTSGSAILQFNKEALGLTGAFLLDNGATLDFNATITTTGCFTNTSGTVDASPSGVCFNWCSGGQDCD